MHEEHSTVFDDTLTTINSHNGINIVHRGFRYKITKKKNNVFEMLQEIKKCGNTMIVANAIAEIVQVYWQRGSKYQGRYNTTAKILLVERHYK